MNSIDIFNHIAITDRTITTMDTPIPASGCCDSWMWSLTTAADVLRPTNGIFRKSMSISTAKWFLHHTGTGPPLLAPGGGTWCNGNGNAMAMQLQCNGNAMAHEKTSKSTLRACGLWSPRCGSRNWFPSKRAANELILHLMFSNAFPILWQPLKTF